MKPECVKGKLELNKRVVSRRPTTSDHLQQSSRQVHRADPLCPSVYIYWQHRQCQSQISSASGRHYPELFHWRETDLVEWLPVLTLHQATTDAQLILTVTVNRQNEL